MVSRERAHNHGCGPRASSTGARHDSRPGPVTRPVRPSLLVAFGSGWKSPGAVITAIPNGHVAAAAPHRRVAADGGAVVMANQRGLDRREGRRVVQRGARRAAADDVEFLGDGSGKGPPTAVDLSQWARRCGPARRPRRKSRGARCVLTTRPCRCVVPYGTAVCEVEGRSRNREVSVVRYTTSTDCGRAVKPMSLPRAEPRRPRRGWGRRSGSLRVDAETGSCSRRR